MSSLHSGPVLRRSHNGMAASGWDAALKAQATTPKPADEGTAQPQTPYRHWWHRWSRQPSSIPNEGKKARMKRVMLQIPTFNFLVQFLILTPSGEAIKDIMNVMALVAALLLSVVMLLPAAVTYDEMIAADARYANTTSGYYTYWEAAVGFAAFGIPSESFAIYSSCATCTLAVSLLITVVMYTFFAMANFRNEADVSLWFKYARWGMLMVVALVLAGVYFFFCANFRLVQIKFPDRHVEATGEQADGPYSATFVFQWMTVGITLSTTIMFGIANAQVYSENKRQAAVEKERLTAQQAKDDAAAASRGPAAGASLDDEGDNAVSGMPDASGRND